MSITHTYPQTFTPQDSLSFADVLSLESYFKYPKNQMDSSCCGAYSLPYIADDTFMITLPYTPTTLQLKDGDDVNIAGGITNSGGIVTIDFTGMTDNIIQVYIDSVCSEFNFHLFAPDTLGCCDGMPSYNNSSIRLYSSYCNYDLLDNDYSGTYSNWIRIFGQLFETNQPKTEETRNENGRLIRRVVKKNYEMITHIIKKDSWIYNHLKESVLVGDSLMIQDDFMADPVEVYVTSPIGDIQENSVFKITFETIGEEIEICC